MSYLLSVLPQIHDSFFLVAIIDNDYIESDLFHYLDEIITLDKTAAAGSSGGSDGKTDNEAEESADVGLDQW